jgi:hypothetical protein
MMSTRAFCHAVGLALLASWVVGCARTEAPMDQPAIDRLSLLGEAYLQTTQKLNRGPRNIDELRQHVPSPHQLANLLTSPHDGQPYVIVWNIDPRQPPLTETPPLLAYEKDGKDGQYDVLTTMGVVRISRQELAKHLASTPGARTP